MRPFSFGRGPSGAGVVAAGARPGGEGYLARTFQSLAVPEFRLLWLGMLFMMGGIRIQMIAQAQLAYDLSGLAFAVGIVGAGFAPPILIFSLFGGVIADRFDRKRIIQIAQIGNLMVSAFVALSIHTGTVTIYHLAGASLCQGLVFAFMMPARQSIIPRLVGEERVSNALALNAGAMSLMTMVGPAVAGILYAQFGPGVALDAVVALSAAAVVLTSMLPSMPPRRTGGESRVGAEMLEGLRYAARRPAILGILLLLVALTLLAMPFQNLMPVYVDEKLGMGARELGYLMSAIGAGSLVGSFGVAALRKGGPRGIVLISSAVVSGVSLAMLSGPANLTFALAVMLIFGVGNACKIALSNALLLEQSDDAYRGRITGLYMMSYGLMPLGILPMGAAADLWGITPTLFVAGALLAAVGAWYMLFMPRVRRL